MLSIPYYRLIDAVAGMDQYAAPSSGAVKILLEPGKNNRSSVYTFLRSQSVWFTARFSEDFNRSHIGLHSFRIAPILTGDVTQ